MGKPTFDVARARRDTPGCTRVLHFNNAGAALMPTPVVESLIAHLQLEASVGGYEAAELAHAAAERAYDAIAALIGCQRDEVAVIENATRAWDLAFYSIPFQAGDRILTCVAEYGSNYIALLQVARRSGAQVEVIPNDEHGQVSLDTLDRMLERPARLIAITHIPTNGGLVNPVAEVGRFARDAGVLYLLDSCQAVGQMPLNVDTIGCDMLSATGRKYLRGPRGTGFLYVRRQVLERIEPVFLDLHSARWTASDAYRVRSDARRFENWESYVAGKIGLGVAVDYAMSWGLESIAARIQSLADSLRRGLAEIPRVRVHDQGAVKCGIVSFTVEGMDCKLIQQALARHHMNVSVSTVEATRLDMEARRLESLVRASVHYYNTEEEVERFCDAVARISRRAG